MSNRTISNAIRGTRALQSHNRGNNWPLAALASAMAGLPSWSIPGARLFGDIGYGYQNWGNKWVKSWAKRDLGGDVYDIWDKEFGKMTFRKFLEKHPYFTNALS